jgi:hypothetical protein
MIPNSGQTNLGLKGCQLIAGAGEYPQLVSLTIADGFLTPKAVSALMNIRAPKLEKLVLNYNNVKD